MNEDGNTVDVSSQLLHKDYVNVTVAVAVCELPQSHTGEVVCPAGGMSLSGTMAVLCLGCDPQHVLFWSGMMPPCLRCSSRRFSFEEAESFELPSLCFVFHFFCSQKRC